MGEPVKLEQLESSEGETFRQLYAIYAASIAAREQKGEGWIAAMIGAPDYRVWVAKAGGLVRGFSILFVPPSGRFALLEYMAVAPAERNHGMGGELFRRRWSRPSPPRGASSPWSWRSTRTARPRATARSGRAGSVLPAARLPPDRRASLHHAARRRGRAARDGPFRVWAEPPALAACAQRRQALAGDHLSRRLSLPPDDPRLAQMVASLPDPVGLD